MVMSNKQLREIAEQVAATMGKGGKRRRLEAVDPDRPPPGLNALQRDVLYSRIADLSGHYRLAWLVRQETMHVSAIVECLSDAELGALLGKLERAVEAIHDGVPFVEVGLIKGATCNWVA